MGMEAVTSFGPRMLIGAVLSFLMPATAWSDDESWRTTFASESVESHLDDGPLAYMLVGAGEVAPGEAARALQKVLESSQRVELVMDDSALGDVRSLSDGTIVEKAAAFPVDRILILRVFGGDETTAVVSIYDEEGESVGAFTGREGEAMAARKADQQGVTPGAAKAVGAIVGDSIGGAEKKRREYEERYLWLEDRMAVRGNQYGVWTTSWQAPRIGKHGEPLSWKDFFGRVGREKLALQVEKTDDYAGTRIFGKVLWMYLGLPCVVLGATLGGTAHAIGASSSMADAGWALLGSGAGLTVIGMSIDFAGPDYPDVRAHEIRRMVNEHNQQLKKELGIARDEEGENQDLRFSAAPVVGPDFVGLGAAFRF